GVFALAVVAYALDRRGGSGAGTPRHPASLLLAAGALVLGALLFAGSLAEGHRESWPGLVAGVAWAAVGHVGLAMVLARGGRAPALAKLIERGTYARDCVSTFPSVTPGAAATIATGVGPAEHHIPSMNWYHRGEARYVEYGSSFEASRTFGIVRSLQDTVYNM